MKKAMKLAVMALAVLGLTTACKQKPAEEIDTMPADTMIIEEVIDSAIEEVAEEVVAEEPVKTKAATKKATKETPKVVDPNTKGEATTTNTQVTVTRTDGKTVTVKAPGTPDAKSAVSVNTKPSGKVATGTTDPSTKR